MTVNFCPATNYPSNNGSLLFQAAFFSIQPGRIQLAASMALKEPLSWRANAKALVCSANAGNPVLLERAHCRLLNAI